MSRTHRHKRTEESLAAVNPAPTSETSEGKRRLASLDAFRGLTILGMLLVNNVALDYATPRHLTHAAWNRGVHFADLVFPWFLFIVGVAIPYAASSRKQRGIPTWKYDMKALGRAVSLLLLGCLVDSSIARRPVLDLGVLQLIGLAYFIGAVLYSLPTVWRLVVASGFLVLHWAFIRFVPIPGIGAGYFTAEHNIINHINQTYLQTYHLSGLISAVPTSALVLIGTAVGDVFRSYKRITVWMLTASLVLGVLGYLWNLDQPFNKPLWTASYILYTAGWSCLVLGIMHWILDVKGWSKWAFPLIVFGSNAIMAYVMPILVKMYILQTWVWTMPDGKNVPLQQAYLHYLKAWFGLVGGGWLYTISYIVFWWLILLYMYRKKVFVRV